MVVVIRKAVEDDLPGLMRLLRQPDMAPHDDMSLEDMRDLFLELNKDGHQEIYVVTNGGQVLGTFLLTLVRHLSHNGGKSLVVEDIVVDETRRGQGIGRQMISFAIDRARALNCYKLVLSSNLARHAAHAFYEKIGFAKHGYSFAVRTSQEL